MNERDCICTVYIEWNIVGVGNGIELKERDYAFLSFCQRLENEVLPTDDINQEQFVIVMQEEIGTDNASDDGNKKKNQNQNQNQKARQQQKMARQGSNCNHSLEEIANRIQVDYFGRYVKIDDIDVTTSTQSINLANLLCFVQAYKQDVPTLALIVMEEEVICPVKHT